MPDFTSSVDEVPMQHRFERLHGSLRRFRRSPFRKDEAEPAPGGVGSQGVVVDRLLLLNYPPSLLLAAPHGWWPYRCGGCRGAQCAGRCVGDTAVDTMYCEVLSALRSPRSDSPRAFGCPAMMHSMLPSSPKTKLIVLQWTELAARPISATSVAVMLLVSRWDSTSTLSGEM